MKRISGGQLSREAKPRFYQVTPVVLGRRRATQALPVRPKQSTQQSRVSPPPARGPTGQVGRHRPDSRFTLTVTAVGRTRFGTLLSARTVGGALPVLRESRHGPGAVASGVKRRRAPVQQAARAEFTTPQAGLTYADP